MLHAYGGDMDTDDAEGPSPPAPSAAAKKKAFRPSKKARGASSKGAHCSILLYSAVLKRLGIPKQAERMLTMVSPRGPCALASECSGTQPAAHTLTFVYLTKTPLHPPRRSLR